MFRLNVTVKGGVVVSTNGIVTVAVSARVVCLSASDSGANGPVLDAVAFVGSRVQAVVRAVSLVAVDDPAYAKERITVASSNLTTDAASCAGEPAPTVT